MKDYPYEIPVEVRFQDIDAMGHVNNAVYVTYVEEARGAFFRDVFDVRKIGDIEYIVAHVEVDFRRSVTLGQRLVVGVRVASVGGTSFAMEYRMEADGELAATARTVQVFYDYGKRAKKPVPDDFRLKVTPYLSA